MSTVTNGTTRRTRTPYRHDMVGSFLRPQALKDAREKWARGEIPAEELRAVEDAEIIRLVEKQKSVGLKAVTDGEFRRSWWHLDFMWGLDGVVKAESGQGYLFHGIETRAETARLTGRIRFTADHPFLDHYRFLHRLAGDDAVARQTLPAPAQFLAELQRPENAASTAAVYADADRLLTDIAAAYREAILAFYEAGCRSIQLDDCTWGMLCDAGFRETLERSGGSAEDAAAAYARVNREAIRGLPEDLAVTTHVCRGNYASAWASSGGYEPVADTLFGMEEYDGYYLEFDTDRSGGFAPLSALGDRQVVLGLISSKDGELEDKDAIVGRVREAARIVGLDHICLSPQCGFASTEEGNLLTEEQQWRKLELIKEIADELWTDEP
ncbi:5-methyltetrahydropteroyltriglutamate--homocysteine S-methyltransferase [Paenibacillus glufosinatiresistens]|uniref:5-methyltetrahydropteroyltriglutamate-- homocysteine S-methyltransferase n=1 Tax=Paenibacillus glufosinatiresistens TaxID=3070657 RepID=UPI00286E0BE5|nr:5-methyltetrahydropteroyltriglutamate--homocysteine S-methyltransferase [Paenibacillus sp. YX.27]